MWPKCKSARMENLSARATYCGRTTKFPVRTADISSLVLISYLPGSFIESDHKTFHYKNIKPPATENRIAACVIIMKRNNFGKQL